MRQIKMLLAALALTGAMAGCNAQIAGLRATGEASGVLAAGWGIGPNFDPQAVGGTVSAPAGTISGGGGHVVNGGGGNIISGGSGNVVSGGAGNLRSLLALSEAPLGAAVVVLTDPDGVPLPGVAPVVTGKDGRFAFANVPSDMAMVVRVAVMDKAGRGAWLERLLPVGADLGTADVTLTTTLATTTLRRRGRGLHAPVTPKEFAATVVRAARVAADMALSVTDIAAMTRAAEKLERDVATPEAASPMDAPSPRPAKKPVPHASPATAAADRLTDDGAESKKSRATRERTAENSPSPSPESAVDSQDPTATAAESTSAPTTEPEPSKSPRPAKHADDDLDEEDESKDGDKSGDDGGDHDDPGDGWTVSDTSSNGEGSGEE